VNFFPGYNNTSGAVGYFILDTTTYEDGVHTIQWTAKDGAGNIDGIGSRFFSIKNTESGLQSRKQRYEKETSLSGNKRRHAAGLLHENDDVEGFPVDDRSPVSVKKGFNTNKEPKLLYPDNNGNIVVQVRELEPLEIHLPERGNSTWNIYKPLIGSTMDTEKGIYYWSPGPGFVGAYRLIFVNTDIFGKETRKDITLIVNPKF